MMAIDTSALFAIAMDEPEGLLFSELISDRETVVGAPTLVELTMALSRVGPARADEFVADLFRDSGLRPVEFTYAMFEAARDAFRLYGKGQGHPAQLNFGDCLSYAVAKVLGVPLLFKGDDFSKTDIEPADRP